MARVPNDTIPQSQLLNLLRVEIDRARKNSDKRALRHIARLVEQNPRSIHSTHVAYNLGSARYRWLCAHVGADAHARTRARAAASSQATRGRSWARIEAWFVTD